MAAGMWSGACSSLGETEKALEIEFQEIASASEFFDQGTCRPVKANWYLAATNPAVPCPANTPRGETSHPGVREQFYRRSARPILPAESRVSRPLLFQPPCQHERMTGSTDVSQFHHSHLRRVARIGLLLFSISRVGVVWGSPRKDLSELGRSSSHRT